jgi:hypothetical protein
MTRLDVTASPRATRFRALAAMAATCWSVAAGYACTLEFPLGPEGPSASASDAASPPPMPPPLVPETGSPPPMPTCVQVDMPGCSDARPCCGPDNAGGATRYCSEERLCRTCRADQQPCTASGDCCQQPGAVKVCGSNKVCKTCFNDWCDADVDCCLGRVCGSIPRGGPGLGRCTDSTSCGRSDAFCDVVTPCCANLRCGDGGRCRSADAGPG